MLQQQVTERVLLLSFDCRNCEESSDECFAKIVAWQIEALGEIFQLLLEPMMSLAIAVHPRLLCLFARIAPKYVILFDEIHGNT